MIVQPFRIVRTRARRIARAAVEAFFPTRCLVCGRFFTPPAPATSAVSRRCLPQSWSRDEFYTTLAAWLCPECRDGYRPVQSPLCTCCGEPFHSRAGEDHLCEECLRRPRHFRRARALAVYDGCWAALIRSFKYRGKCQLARPLGALLLAAFGFYWKMEAVDLIVPVPLHGSRLRRRGFNQALLLIDRWPVTARPRAAPPGGTAIDPRVLRRVRAAPPQTALQRRARRENLRGAFDLRDPSRVEGRRVLLIDDVLTTGATADECARVLMDGGARWVDVLTLARTAAGGPCT